MHSSPAILALALAERERRRRAAARVRAPSFGEWLPQTSPAYRWDWAHTRHIRAALDRVTAGEIRRLMLFVPPRHGKSELATIHYPAYRLEVAPALRVVVGAYNATLAEKFSRRTRSIARRRGVPMDAERQAVNDWVTTEGGGLRAVGVGGGITGQGGDLIIIDDPVKSREEADSPAYRERVWSWYTDDLYTRLEPGAAMILIMTRWHEDDLAGRILASDQAHTWTVISLPALAEDDDPLGRPVGAALCRDRFDEVALADIRQTLGPRGWQALYQQRPVPPEGAMFRREWFSVERVAPQEGRRVRYWDIGGAAAGEGDYTVGLLMSRSADGRFWIEDVQRFQLTAAPRAARIVQQAALDQQRYGRVEIVIEQPPGLGNEPIADLARALAGYIVSTDNVRVDKVGRAEPLSRQAELRNVALVAGGWNTAFLDELCAFPFGAHDDQVDTASGSFNRLVAGVVTLPQRPRERVANRFGGY